MANKTLLWFNNSFVYALNIMYHVFTAPSYLCVKGICHDNTRTSTGASAIPPVKSMINNSFDYNGIKLWNHLPMGVKPAQPRDDFKKKK